MVTIMLRVGGGRELEVRILELRSNLKKAWLAEREEQSSFVHLSCLRQS